MPSQVCFNSWDIVIVIRRRKEGKPCTCTALASWMGSLSVPKVIASIINPAFKRLLLHSRIKQYKMIDKNLVPCQVGNRTLTRFCSIRCRNNVSTDITTQTGTPDPSSSSQTDRSWQPRTRQTRCAGARRLQSLSPHSAPESSGCNALPTWRESERERMENNIKY